MEMKTYFWWCTTRVYVVNVKNVLNQDEFRTDSIKIILRVNRQYFEVTYEIHLRKYKCHLKSRTRAGRYVMY
jgi:hypothetical protein